jgi:hypothetical protein
VNTRLFLSAAAAICIAGCGVTQPVRVLDDHTSAITASLGGPVIPAAGITFPVPYLNAGFAYGITPDITTTANVHITALLFSDIGFDVGAAARLLSEHGPVPEITMKLQGLYFTTLNPDPQSLFLAHASVNASYRIGARSLVYTGTEHTLQFHGAEYFFTPFLGMQFPLSGVMDAQGEIKWLAANHFTGHGVFEGAGSVNEHGNIGVYFGVLYHLGRR